MMSLRVESMLAGNETTSTKPSVPVIVRVNAWRESRLVHFPVPTPNRQFALLGFAWVARNWKTDKAVVGQAKVNTRVPTHAVYGLKIEVARTLKRIVVGNLPAIA